MTKFNVLIIFDLVLDRLQKSSRIQHDKGSASIWFSLLFCFIEVLNFGLSRYLVSI